MKFWFLPSSQIPYRGGCAIPLFQISVWCEKCVAARHYAVICKQLLNANDINRVRWVVLDLLQDGACTDFFENLSENSLKGDLSNATTFNPPLFSLLDIFKAITGQWSKGLDQGAGILWRVILYSIVRQQHIFRHHQFKFLCTGDQHYIP
jgi:hypothetical protein